MEKLKIVATNLTFSTALTALKEGKWIKVPEWEGYWFLKGGQITVKTWDGQELTTPWYHQNVLREDWQIVEIDKEWEKEEADKRSAALRDAILNDAGCSLQPGTPVQENSLKFEEWLQNQQIEYRNSGHQTIILGHRDMFEIGRAWGTYKTNHQTASASKSPNNQ